MKKLKKSILYLSILLSSSSVYCSDNEQMSDETVLARNHFPSNITMKINNEERLLGREINFCDNLHESNNVKISASNYPHPLDYIKFKKSLGLNNQNPVFLAYNQAGCFWEMEGEKLTPTTINLFSEGMRFLYNTDFKVVTGFGGNHATFLNGNYVFCAGLIKFDENGCICSISNDTGHMQSIKIQLQQMVADLHRIGAISPFIHLTDWQRKKINLEDCLSSPINAEEFEGVKQVSTPEIVSRNYKEVVLDNALVEKDHFSEKPLALKVLEILDHKSQLENLSTVPPHLCGNKEASELYLEKTKNEKKLLEENKPHEEIYDQVLEIQSLLTRIDDHKLCFDYPIMHGAGGMLDCNPDEVKVEQAKSILDLHSILENIDIFKIIGPKIDLEKYRKVLH